MIRVVMTTESLGDLMTPSTLHLRCVNGLPKDAKFVNVLFFDKEKRVVFYYDDSKAETTTLTLKYTASNHA